MSQRIFLRLVLFVMVMLFLVYMLSLNTEEGSESQLLFPTLKENISELHRLEIITASGATTLVRNNEQWTVTQRDGYPAQREELSKIAQQLIGLSLKEKKTSKDKNYALLGVSDGDAVRVELYAGEQVFRALFGKASAGREGRFVRLGSQVWLSDEIQILEKTSDWLEPIIIDVDSEDIARVEMGSLIFRRNEEDAFYVNELPDTRELRYPSILEEPARALAKLSLEDVTRHDPTRWTDARRTSFFTKSGLEIRVLAIRQNKSNWLHLRFLQDLVMSEGASTGDHNILEGNSYSASETLSDWDFRVPDYVYDNFVLGLDDLLKDVSDSK